MKQNSPSKPSPKKKSAPSSVSGVSGASGQAGASPHDTDDLPGKEAIAALQAGLRVFTRSPGQERVRRFLERLSVSPPQVLLLEGGTASDRLHAAHYWALLLNCPERAGALSKQPCLACRECVRMLTHLHRDCFFFDGLAGSIKIDEVRAMRELLGEPPREARHRVVIFREAQSLVEAAANALLKSFEEPRPGASFLLLVPQRERLLPTLVSRSLVLTLPWPSGHAHEQDPAQAGRLAAWEASLCLFLHSGREFLEQSGVKGAVDAPLVQDIVALCRRALIRRLTAEQSGRAPGEGLELCFARMPLQRLRMLDEALAECQDSLLYTVNPAMVLEWLATRLYLLVPRQR